MAKTPRFDRYNKLLSRFYEALYLLHLLGRTRGPRIITNLNPTNIADTRRRFLKNLATVCDYRKGGPSTTAIAIEDRQDCNVLWVSSNEGPKEKVLTFLEEVLGAIKTFSELPQDRQASAEEDLMRKCVEFADKRIGQQARDLRASARKCRKDPPVQHVPGEEGKTSFTYLTYTNYTYPMLQSVQ